MTLIPPQFLFRIAHSCRFIKRIPREDGDRLLDLPEDCSLENFADMEGRKNYADVRVAWNTFGLAFHVEVRGKEQVPQADAAKIRASDGVTLWIDTRGSRTSHRASRYCHQFHFLPVGGGSDREDPVMVQTKINRALQDSPLCRPAEVPFRSELKKTGYLIEAFLPAGVLNGFDPDENPQLGVFYAVRDNELGEQTLSVTAEFPYWEDPSLWSLLDLVR